ncbi:MAG: molybdopterin-synthase adenylyltransferase MoeB [Deltaproteobacteria bacterium]|nr:molybdopterin-synthase adenylyltransferase MoeB [Deltaproteobacteria bacterium]MBT4642102.1 molybdopterin-synthase adenylyltransferase MoeB [Deltaproteobacteria bacterium]MBT6499483.1 molybdopterin-synthase adenylyltransferase MoeB [Deltaproteobacteria bacterium]MBT6615052.1 molybdopterin-synthase adenylyltransferase MoeB [Deltaproteobacteria bacterium]MBT7154074.1 molybdopterin-synthase adenylyltransferase MoeB [Deltaproteobacteria bacterium]
MDYSDEQIERYSRHIILKEVGLEGQMKISQAKVLVIGAGGLGSPVLLYLAAAGIGKIGIADNDVLDISNLQRQVIHSTPDLNRPKVDSAKDRINALNPDVLVEAINGSITADNILGIIENYDFVIDGTDNFASKFLINDACVIAGKPFSHGGILRFHGQTLTVVPPESACYRCVFIEPPPPDSVPTCSQAGVLGVMAGVLGTLQANECLKYILNQGDLLTNRLLIFDALKTSFTDVKLKKNPKCPVCGENPTIKSLTDYEQAICDIKS